METLIPEDTQHQPNDLTWGLWIIVKRLQYTLSINNYKISLYTQAEMYDRLPSNSQLKTLYIAKQYNTQKHAT